MDGLAGMRADCSAPGKVILFGEHAVVYGHPAVAAVTDQRTHVEVHCCGDQFTVNGFRIQQRFHAYIKTAVERLWDRPDAVRIHTEGGVPSASGTGSSAALTVACVAGLLRLQDVTDPAAIAQASFEVERATQGGGSPLDTSTSTAGGAVAVSDAASPPGLGEPAWSCSWQERSWAVERLSLAPITVVVGNSGVRSRTDEQVRKVANAARRNPIVRESLHEAGQLARQAVPLLARRDLEAVGRLMDKAHMALHTIGVNHPGVQRLVDAAKGVPGTLGAKITGAGGGGSMVALTDRPEDVARAVEAAGGTAFQVTLGGPGLLCEGRMDEDPVHPSL